MMKSSTEGEVEYTSLRPDGNPQGSSQHTVVLHGGWVRGMLPWRGRQNPESPTGMATGSVLGKDVS